MYKRQKWMQQTVMPNDTCIWIGLPGLCNQTSPVANKTCLKTSPTPELENDLLAKPCTLLLKSNTIVIIARSIAISALSVYASASKVLISPTF